MTFGILLSRSGVYDGGEIRETTMAMLAITELGHSYQCIAMNKDQHHVLNHLNDVEMDETRNMMVEAGRIARGDVKEMGDISPSDVDILVIPGGFG